MDHHILTFMTTCIGLFGVLAAAAIIYAVYRSKTEDLTIKSRTLGRLHQSIWVPAGETVLFTLVGALIVGSTLMSLEISEGEDGIVHLVMGLFSIALVGVFAVRVVPGFRGGCDVFFDKTGVRGPRGFYALGRQSLTWKELTGITRVNGNWWVRGPRGRFINIHSGYQGRGSFRDALKTHRPDLAGVLG